MATVHVNAGECDGSETVHEIHTEADAERLFGRGSTAYGLAMMGLRSHTEVRALFGEADASGPDRTGMVLAELTREGTTRAPEMRDPDPRIQKWVDAAERIAARPTLRIYDPSGDVLADGAMTATGNVLSGRVQIAQTGTADTWSLDVGGLTLVNRRRIGDGLRLNSLVLCSGWWVDIPRLVLESGEPSVGPLPSLAEAMRDDLGNDPAQWFARGRSAPWPENKFGPIFGGGESAFCVFIANLKAWEEREARQKAERQQREAPLVALVSQVPEGLDPVGWRAAVLVLREGDPAIFDGNIGNVGPALGHLLGEFVRSGEMPDTFFPASVFEAYRRAIAPHKAPAPERRQGGKAVRLTVDDGREDD